MLAAIIFDVEGTLIDCVPHILACWQVVLATAGHHFSRDDLQRYSGMDGADMLDRLLPHVAKADKALILEVQGETYRRHYLHLGRAFPGVQDLFARLDGLGLAIGLATSCKGDELRAYDREMRILELVDAVACGDDASKGKPHPDLYRAVLGKLTLHRASRVMSVGDSPYDAVAAKASGLHPVGVMTGGFTAQALAEAGCEPVLRDVGELRDMGQLRQPPPAVT